MTTIRYSKFWILGNFETLLRFFFLDKNMGGGQPKWVSNTITLHFVRRRVLDQLSYHSLVASQVIWPQYGASISDFRIPTCQASYWTHQRNRNSPYGLIHNIHLAFMLPNPWKFRSYIIIISDCPRTIYCISSIDDCGRWIIFFNKNLRLSDHRPDTWMTIRDMMDTLTTQWHSLGSSTEK